MTPFEFGAMFVLGLVSSLHCLQMCGPIVLSYSVAVESLGKKSSGASTLPALLQNHLAYNAGRILTYTALGAIAGMAGGAMGALSHLVGLNHTLAIVTGGFMVLVGISMFGVIPAGRWGSRLFLIPASFLKRLGRLLSAEGAGKRFVLGLTLGFLPCGLIYAALLKAMATGSALAGAATMFAFGLGTAGALLALGIFSSAIRVRLNRWGSQLAAAGVTMMGIVLIWRGTLPGMLIMGGHVHGHH